MDEMAVSGVLSKAAIAAFLMRDSAARIEKELPSFKVSDALLEECLAASRDLLGACRGIYCEMGEVDPLMVSGASDEVIGQRLERIGRWAGEPIARMRAVVQAAEADHLQGNADAAVVALLSGAVTSLVKVHAAILEAIREALATGRPGLH